MPIKDDDARRQYMRDYMKRRRAGQEKPQRKTVDELQAMVDALSNRIGELEADLARERAKPVQAAAVEIGSLSPHSKKRLEIAIRQHTQMLDREFEARVSADAQKMAQRLMESSLDYYNERLAYYEEVIRSRTGLMPRSVFRIILARLHPDIGGNAEVFDLFKKLERIVVADAEMPADFHGLPTLEELMARM